MLRALPLSEFVQEGGMKEDKKKRKHKKDNIKENYKPISFYIKQQKIAGT